MSKKFNNYKLIVVCESVYVSACMCAYTGACFFLKVYSVKKKQEKISG